MVTRNGVCYDLEKTPYKCTIGNLTYMFSSQTHLDKFKSRIKENRDIINYSLTNRFKMSVDVSELADVVLYRKIETRGFLIVTDKGIKLCQKSITFRGNVPIIRS